jgi:Uma2 family endonuclease
MAKADVSAPPEAAPARLMTAEELLRLPTGMGECYELVAGQLKTTPANGMLHGYVEANVGSLLAEAVRNSHLGDVVGAGTGFILSRNPDTVRAPDVAFVSQSRIPTGRRPQGYFPGAPDLAVEVISPSECAADINRKVTEYFEAGAHLVWIVYPDTCQVVVYRSARESLALADDDTLDGGELVSGFACRVAELFE